MNIFNQLIKPVGILLPIVIGFSQFIPPSMDNK